MIGFYALYTIGELLLFPVFWSTINHLAPKRNKSLMMAVALSSIGLGSTLAGKVGSYVDELGEQQIFSGIMVAMFVLSGICFLLNKKLVSMTEEDQSSSRLSNKTSSTTVSA
jgi:dipeptide/tripeptide permease